MVPSGPTACPATRRATTIGLPVIVCLTADTPRRAEDEQRLREAGVGICLSSGAGILEMMPAHDLAINVILPTLARMPLKLRRQLGPVYEKFPVAGADTRI